MSKSTCHSRLPLSSSLTSPDIENLNSMDNQNDYRRISASNDKRQHNVNYVRHVIRRFFGSYSRKSSPLIHDESEQSPTSPVLLHPSLQYEKHTKFSGKKNTKGRQREILIVVVFF